MYMYEREARARARTHIGRTPSDHKRADLDVIAQAERRASPIMLPAALHLLKRN